eukprot:2501201-Pleurochrysis_carterae.AAC.1
MCRNKIVLYNVRTTFKERNKELRIKLSSLEELANKRPEFPLPSAIPSTHPAASSARRGAQHAGGSDASGVGSAQPRRSRA